MGADPDPSKACRLRRWRRGGSLKGTMDAVKVTAAGRMKATAAHFLQKLTTQDTLLQILQGPGAEQRTVICEERVKSFSQGWGDGG